MPPPPGATTETFTPGLIDDTRRDLRLLLGGAWSRIVAADDPTLRDGERHLLAVIDQHSAGFTEDYRLARLPGNLPDFMALYLIVSLLRRMQGEEILREVLPSIHERRSFRHDMLTLGIADHFRLQTPYPVRMPPPNREGLRTVDLIVGATPEFDIETKSADEFDGPRCQVSEGGARQGIRKAWRRAYAGDDPQVRPDRPSALLVGGVTVEVASMPNIFRVAEGWLEARGGEQPNCWGILAMTFITISRLPPGRRFGDGAPMVVNALASPILVGAKNPHYTGPVQLVLTPPNW